MTTKLPTWNEKDTEWQGGDTRTLFAFVDERTGSVEVRPGQQFHRGVGPACAVRLATRAEAEAGWQYPLNPRWNVAD